MCVLIFLETRISFPDDENHLRMANSVPNGATDEGD